jgi:hypothetical protein
MQYFLNMAIEASITKKDHSMHNDLIISHRYLQETKRRKIEKNFKESDIEKFKRLAYEYDLICDNEHAEWYT